ncbi:MAG: tRNA lysidine(34) synthetase TilS [Lachnospiraceae bacterium]|nr:tRNA lysidine(34) synthetase TilS [Lachnospiraceae bacterium]
MGRFLADVYNYIMDNNMISAEDKLVVGLSGGADSVCLLCTLCELKSRLGMAEDSIVAVHINHMIRGEESDGDEEFCRKLCHKLSVPFQVFSKDITAYAKDMRISVEEAGRKYRYESFNQVLSERGFNKIAVAHNKNDLAETVIFNMLRGTGLNGMAGISAVRDNIIRPLLDVTRQDIEAYLENIHQNYRTDSTNLGLDYDRNKIRHIILPAMEEVNSRAVEHICHMAEEAKESYSYIHGKAVAKFEDSKTVNEEKSVALDINQIYKYNPVLQEHLVHEALGQVAGAKKDITRKHVMSVVSLIYQDTGKMVELPYGIRARRSYEQLIISNKAIDTEDYCIEISGEGEYNIPKWGNLHISFMDNNHDIKVSKKIYTKMADYGKMKDSLCIRTPKEGDYIVIDSEGRTKKLSRVFIDSKVDREARTTWPVLACGHEIIWALGLRYSEAYKIEQNTTKIIYMNYEGKGEG